MKKTRMRTCRKCGRCDEYVPHAWTGNLEQVVDFAQVPCKGCGDTHLTFGSWVKTFLPSELKAARPDLYEGLCRLYVGCASGLESIDPPDDSYCRYEELDNRAVLQRVAPDQRSIDSIYYDPKDDRWHDADAVVQ